MTPERLAEIEQAIQATERAGWYRGIERELLTALREEQAKVNNLQQLAYEDGTIALAVLNTQLEKERQLNKDLQARSAALTEALQDGPKATLVWPEQPKKQRVVDSYWNDGFQQGWDNAMAQVQKMNTAALAAYEAER